MGAAGPSIGAGRGYTAAVLGACALLLAPTLGYRMGLDQGVFAYLGAELLEGRWPYLETWDHAFPGLAFLQALEIGLLGRSIAMFRLFDLAVQLLSALLIFRIAERLASRAGATLAAACFALIYQGYGPWNTAQREGFGLPLLLLGFWLWLRAGGRRPVATAVGIGLGIGAAATIKPTLAAFALAYAPLLRGAGRGALRPLLAAAAAALAPAAVFVALYAWRGGLGDLWEACIVYQTDVYVDRLRGDAPLLSSWFARLGRLGPQALALALVYPPFLLWGPRRRERVMLALGYAGCVIAVLVQGTFAGYHYLPGLGVGAVLVGSVFAQCLEHPPPGLVRRLGRPPARAALPLAWLLILAAVPLYVKPEAVRRVLRLEFLDAPVPGELRIGSVFDFSEDFELAAHLRANTRPEERVQVWGHESLVYYLAQRDAASRFQTSNPLVTRPSRGVLTPMQWRWRAEFLRDVEARAPRYVVVTRDDHWWWAPGERSSQELLDDFPEWKRWIAAHYALERSVGRFLVYRRLEAGGP